MEGIVLGRVGQDGGLIGSYDVADLHLLALRQLQRFFALAVELALKLQSLRAQLLPRGELRDDLLLGFDLALELADFELVQFDDVADDLE